MEGVKKEKRKDARDGRGRRRFRGHGVGGVVGRARRRLLIISRGQPLVQENSDVAHTHTHPRRPRVRPPPKGVRRPAG